ncbi:hypothetical protein Z043_109497, partial [Scleropages formosus]
YVTVLSLYESTFQELQDVQRSLNLFRTQMMDLELALVRQQSTLYQNLSDGERQEAQVLQQLRSAVRQELQELELQLEDRLLSLEEQLRSSRSASAYRHHAGLHRARSSDSLSSASSLSAAEPALEILREHAGHEGRPSAACSTASGFSSRSGSPARALRSRGAARERGSHTPERYGSSKAGVYRASVSLTPTPPPRPGVAPVSAGIQPPPREEADPGEQGARGRAVSPHLRQLIEQVKESIADEVRQEILGEILAAVAPCRSAASAREPLKRTNTAEQHHSEHLERSADDTLRKHTNATVCRATHNNPMAASLRDAARACVCARVSLTLNTNPCLTTLVCGPVLVLQQVVRVEGSECRRGAGPRSGKALRTKGRAPPRGDYCNYSAF